MSAANLSEVSELCTSLPCVELSLCCAAAPADPLRRPYPPLARHLPPTAQQVLQGVARGTWLLSWAWVDACLQAGAWVDEGAYEARGMASLAPRRLLDGPRVARMCRAAGGWLGLLEGRQAHVLVPQGMDPCHHAHLRSLVEAAGGTLVSGGSAATAGDVLLLMPPRGGHEAEAAAALRSQAPEGRTRIISMTWLFDSLSAGTLLPRSEYVWQ